MAQFERKFTGGQSRDAVLILESNQNHATVKDTEICPTLPTSMGMGGGYVPMVVLEVKNEADDIQSNQSERGV